EDGIVVFGTVVLGALEIGTVEFGTIERIPVRGAVVPGTVVRGTIVRDAEVTSWHVSSTGLTLHRTPSSLRASTSEAVTHRTQTAVSTALRAPHAADSTRWSPTRPHDRDADHINARENATSAPTAPWSPVRGEVDVRDRATGRRRAAHAGRTGVLPRRAVPRSSPPDPAGWPHRGRVLPGALASRPRGPLHARGELHRVVLLESVRQGRNHHLGNPSDRLPFDRAGHPRVRTTGVPTRSIVLLVHVLPHPDSLPLHPWPTAAVVAGGTSGPRRSGRGMERHRLGSRTHRHLQTGPRQGWVRPHHLERSH